jgi:hypothetical protein
LTPLTSIGALLWALAAGPPPNAEPAKPAESADLALIEEVRRIGGHVGQLLQEPFRRPPLATRATDEARQAAALEQVERLISRERLSARGRAWADLGLGDEGSPRRLWTTLASDLHGIGLDAGGERLLLSPQQLTEQDFHSVNGEGSANFLQMTGVRPDEPAVVHMLVHVLQRARGGSEKLEPTTDRMLAGRAWAEGEANLVAVRYLFDGMGLADELLQSNLDPTQLHEGRLVPAALGRLGEVEEALVRFVYVEGYAQAAQAFKSGGWEGLRRAMSHAVTTRDLLHADRKLEPKQDVPPPGFSPIPRVAGLVRVDEDSLGEQAIVTLVSTQAGKDNLGLLAGEGWIGDRVHRWEKPGETRGITDWETSWVSPEQAAEFEYSLGRVLTARFAQQPLSPKGEGLRELREGDRIFRLEHRGWRVRLLVIPATWDAEPTGSG